MLPISVCIIMKNEEKNLARCLDAIKDYGFELVLVDTGSTDSTVEIAKQYTPTVHHYTWTHNFAEARNYSLSLSSHDWVLVLDCDEIVTSLQLASLYHFMEKHPYGVGLITRRNHYESNGTDAVYTDLVERFFNRKYYHYAGKVHEQVIPISLNGNIDCTSGEINVIAEHTGYVGSIEELQQKAERNNVLLLEMLRKTPNDPYLYFQLGQSYNMLHDDEHAVYYYGKGLEYDVDPSLEYVQMMVIGYGYALLHLERYEEALQFQNIYDEFATTADFVCLMGLIYLRTGHILQAMKEFLKATTFETAKTEGANTFIPTFNMGCINELMGNKDTAITLYRKCGNFKPALKKINELSE